MKSIDEATRELANDLEAASWRALKEMDNGGIDLSKLSEEQKVTITMRRKAELKAWLPVIAAALREREEVLEAEFARKWIDQPRAETPERTETIDPRDGTVTPHPAPKPEGRTCERCGGTKVFMGDPCTCIKINKPAASDGKGE